MKQNKNEKIKLFDMLFDKALKETTIENCGRFGEAFEWAFRSVFLTRNNKDFIVRTQNQTDVVLTIDGKKCYCEIKTGNGRLIDNFQGDFKLKKAQFLIYSPNCYIDETIILTFDKLVEFNNYMISTFNKKVLSVKNGNLYFCSDFNTDYSDKDRFIRKYNNNSFFGCLIDYLDEQNSLLYAIELL